MNQDIVIDINNITKIYKMYEKPSDRFKEALGIGRKTRATDFYALSDVSFSIKKGETVGIIGRNGSGKSTILKILTGVLNPTSGSSNVNGKISALLELGAGFNMEYTGIENIYLNAAIMNISRKEIENKMDDILSFADIGDHINQPVKTYSSGMFVRLAFAVAINVNPDILIVDEALAVGDTRFQLKCMDKFIEFMDAGKTVLFVSHDINAIKRFCTRTIWLNQGNLVMDGETSEVTDRYLDFLKSELSMEEYQQSHAQKSKVEIEQESLDNIDIAEIQRVEIHNRFGAKTDSIQHGESMTVDVEYYVNDTNVNTVVLGVAIRTVDNEYICGVNTLLDHQKISWNQGMNHMELSYDKVSLIGGEYYLDVALFDSTATVPIDYKSRVKTFFVQMDYIAEGKVVLDHTWKNV